MQPLRSHIFLLCLCIVSPCLVFGQNENRDASYWRRAYGEDPNKTINIFNMGVILQNQKKYRQAFRMYRKVIRKKSRLTPVCYYYIARMYQELNKLKKAQKYVSRIQVDKVPKSLKKRVLLLKNSLSSSAQGQQENESKEFEKKASFYFEAGAGTNSNPTYAATDEENDVQTQLKVYSDYPFVLTETSEFKIDYGFGATLYKDEHGASTTYHDFLFPYAYYFGDSRVRLLPEYVADTYGGDLYSHTYSLGVDYSLKHETSYYTLYAQTNKADVSDPEESYLDGTSSKISFIWKKRWESSQTALDLTYASYSYEDTDSVTSSYSAPTLSLTYTKYWAKWDATIYLQYEGRTYDLDSSDFEREDTRATASLRFGRSLGEPWRFFNEWAHSTNSSNDSDNDYSQLYGVIGFSAGF